MSKNMNARTLGSGLLIAGLTLALTAVPEGGLHKSAAATPDRGSTSPLASQATLPSHPVASVLFGTKEGYLAGIWGFRNKVTLSVVEGIGLDRSATYEVNGRVRGGKLRARFGRLGRVAVEFRPSGRVKVRRPPKRCQGPVRRTMLGTFVGTIRFHGEQGYTRFDRREAEGTLETAARWRCDGASPSSERRHKTTHAVLAATAVRSGLSFRAGALRTPGKRGLTVFRANSSERRGGMKIERSALAFGRDQTFIFDDGLNSATLGPPRPFSGSATFLTNPDGTSSWAGQLRVDFLGASNRSLANDTFSTRLYRGGSAPARASGG